MIRVILVIYLLLFAPSLSAAPVDELKKVALGNVNALIILTSQDMMTSGSYTFSSGAEIRVYNFPAYYHFDPLFDNVNLFVNGSVGYSKLRSDLDFGVTPADKMEYRTTALRLGGGVRYDSDFDIDILGGFNFIYSYIQNSYDYNSAETKTNLQPTFDEVFANQYSNAYTYEMFFKIGYYPNWAEWKPYVEWGNNFFDTKIDHSVKELTSFSSSSVSATMKIGFETPQFLHLYNTGLSAEFFVGANAFGGNVRDTLGFDGYGSVAVLLHLYLNSGFYGDLDDELYNVPSLLNRVDIMVESVEGDGISGYNIGISAGFDF